MRIAGRDLTAGPGVAYLLTMAKKSISKGVSNKRTQAFTFSAPSAMSVMLAGDFTHWQKSPVGMQKGADGLWRVAVDLSPGTYHYRFLVDGEWQDDPECTLRVANPYGSFNAVRKVD
jgi:1,4-alpha-glucan branching enzyme